MSENPEYYKELIANLEEKVSRLQETIQKLQEEVRKLERNPLDNRTNNSRIISVEAEDYDRKNKPIVTFGKSILEG